MPIRLLLPTVLCLATAPALALDCSDVMGRHDALMAEAKGRAPGNETDALRKKATDLVAACMAARTAPRSNSNLGSVDCAGSFGRMTSCR